MSRHNKKDLTSICIDVETTGLIAGIHEIIALTAIEYDEDFKPKAKFSTLVQPNRLTSITEEALAVNGLKLSDLLKAPTSVSVRMAFVDWCKEVIGKRIFPMGFNYSFDKGFLIKFLGVKIYDDLFHYKFRDASVVLEAMQEAGYYPELERHGLIQACQYFDIIHKPHDSYGDVMATIRLYKTLIKDITDGLGRND